MYALFRVYDVPLLLATMIVPEVIPAPVRTSLIESAVDALNVSAVPMILPVTGMVAGVTSVDPEERVCDTET